VRLQDKVIAITGSGSGLGREGALLFASEGATIVTSDVVPGRAQAVAKEVEAIGGTALGLDADVRVEDDMERLVNETVGAFGRIDVMWANAGIPEPGFGMQQFVDSQLEDWHNIFAVNTTGIYLAWKHAARWMVANGKGGNLLATTSASAFVAYPGFPMYAASKAAGNGLTRAVALELGKHGIRANALCPGSVDSPSLHERAHALGDHDEIWKTFVARQPMGRMAQPEEMAHICVYLASDESNYATGTNFIVDGGITM
jgi:NAD(P)-dependent dehydrogenase (short-subunit alcohol dehydrogenase family)